MAQWVLQQNRQVVPRRILRRLSKEELHTSNVVEARKREAFDQEIKRRLGDSLEVPKEPDVKELEFEEEYEPEESYQEGSPDDVIPEADAIDSTGRPLNQQPLADLLINAEVLLGHDDNQ